MLLARPIDASDVEECARVIGDHPVIGPRYGAAIADLPKALLRALDYEGRATLILEDADGPRRTICFVGVSLFATDEFVREIKTPPLFWMGPRIVRRMLRGEVPVVTSRQLRQLNSSGGLTALTWEGCIRAGYERHSEIHRKIVSGFIGSHAGYLWKEAIAAQLESAERLRWTLQTGGLLWDPVRGRYTDASDKDLERIVREPHIVGVSRELERGRPGTWVGALFDYHKPRFGFSPAEQRLLLAMLASERLTDDAAAASLGISIGTIKKMWLSIYARVARHDPRVILDSSKMTLHVVSSERGKEKRRRLLAYLREHPEELRPFSQKVLERQSTPARQPLQR